MRLAESLRPWPRSERSERCYRSESRRVGRRRPRFLLGSIYFAFSRSITAGVEVQRIAKRISIRVHRAANLAEALMLLRITERGSCWSIYALRVRTWKGLSALWTGRVRERPSSVLRGDECSSMALPLRVQPLRSDTSASQFNREYSRLFGQPPKRDIQTLRLPDAPLLELVSNL